MEKEELNRINELARLSKRKLWIIPLVIIVVLVCAFFLYTGHYYHADPSAAEALVSDDAVMVTKTDYGWFFDGPSTEDAMIFYPGGKVDETAYAPLMHLLAEKGLDICLVRMPFHLAVLGMNKADDILSAYDYARWYIGGHSLGGAVAAIYAAGHIELDGVILCAAYPTKQLDENDLELIIYGSEDGVLDRDKLIEGQNYASDNVVEYEIDGGNHAQFGNYGVQSGDGEASISTAEQQEMTAEVIIQNVQGD